MYIKENRPFISLDLGTSNILAYVAGQGLVYSQPSLMAYDINTNQLVAIGEEAYDLVGKTSDNIRLVTPLVDGVIADLDAARDLLSHIFGRLKMMNFWKNSVVLLACPSGVTELERDALKMVAKGMGADLVVVEEEVKMSAIGAGINIEMPEGNLVVDIGGGTTDVAIISANDIVVSRSVKIAGEFFNEEILKYIRAEYNLSIGIKTAENIKKTIGSLVKYPNERTMQIYGRDVISGLPKEARVGSEEIRNILLSSFSKITDAIIEVMENTPPELAGDIMKNGIILCGGGALVRNVDKYFFDIFQLPARIAADPLACVIDGTKAYEKVIQTRVEEGFYKNKQDTYLETLK